MARNQRARKTSARRKPESVEGRKKRNESQTSRTRRHRCGRALPGRPITAAQAEDTIYVPLLTYRTGPFSVGGIPIANGMHDYLRNAQRARRRHRRRQAGHRGMRNRLRHQERSRMLRGGEGQEPDGDQSVVDRHHAGPDPEGLGRQDPDPVDGLRPVGVGDRRNLPLDLQSAGDLLGRPVDDPAAISAARKAASTSSRARPSASSSWKAATAASRSRCCSTSPRTTASR